MTRTEMKNLINANRYSLEDFWAVCPHPMIEILGKSRKSEFLIWRRAGMAWLWLSGCSMTHAARQFNKDHATLINAIKQLSNALTTSGYDEQIEVIELIKETSWN